MDLRRTNDGHEKAAMTCERWGGLGEYHNERHRNCKNRLHDSDVLPSLLAGKNADAVSGQLGRRYRRGQSEWHPDFVLIGSDCIGSFCDLQSVTCDVWFRVAAARTDEKAWRKSKRRHASRGAFGAL